MISRWNLNKTRRSGDAYLDFQSATPTHRLWPVVVESAEKGNHHFLLNIQCLNLYLGPFYFVDDYLNSHLGQQRGRLKVGWIHTISSALFHNA